MPPWLVERNVGVQKFKENRSLSDADIATIAAWVDGGAPLGNPADLPPPATFRDQYEWFIGEPDLIVEKPPTTVKAYAPKFFSNFYVDSGLTEDRYISAAEGKPGPGGFKVFSIT